jgi:hypothetical protein
MAEQQYDKDREDRRDRQDKEDRNERQSKRDGDLGVLREHMANIDKNTACLPILCDTVARHDERIMAVTKAEATTSARLWGFAVAVVVVALSGIFGLVALVLKAKL